VLQCIGLIVRGASAGDADDRRVGAEGRVDIWRIPKDRHVHKVNNTRAHGAAREQGKTLVPLKEETALADCGLDSLGFAVLVVRLEDKLGIDPFTAAEEASFPVTFGDFVKVYKNGRG
jgi:acyl carrier protein